MPLKELDAPRVEISRRFRQNYDSRPPTESEYSVESIARLATNAAPFGLRYASCLEERERWGSRYNPTSLRTYGNRFSAAISHYLRYLEDPPGFRAGQTKNARSKGSEKSSPGSKDAAQAVPQRQNPRAFSSTQEPGDLVQYPFPLRLGVMASSTHVECRIEGRSNAYKYSIG